MSNRPTVSIIEALEINEKSHLLILICTGLEKLVLKLLFSAQYTSQFDQTYYIVSD